jgi:lysozyme family protein
MGASFDKFKPLLLPAEGGYVDTPDDAGGATKYGISQSSYPSLDIATLTIDDAYDILQRDFWDKYNLGNITSQDIANKLMLFLINENPFSAVRCMQRALNRFGVNIIVDGILGAGTIEMINKVIPAGWLLDRFRIEGALFYGSRVRLKPDQVKFLLGWMNRALS